jgi:hypothetical protein
MNEQEIDSLEGRELDLAVERYVFGNKNPSEVKANWDYKMADGCWFGQVFEEDYGRWIDVVWPPEYHNSDDLAFQVVDKIECKTVSFMLYQMTSHKSDKRVFEADFFNPRTTITIGANISRSRPLAICRAALKVVCNGK